MALGSTGDVYIALVMRCAGVSVAVSEACADVASTAGRGTLRALGMESKPLLSGRAVWHGGESSSTRIYPFTAGGLVARSVGKAS